MTWFQYHNYGTALQVTSLSKTIEKLGYVSEVVNYKESTQPVKLHNVGIFKDGVKKITHRIKNHLYVRYENPKREKQFEVFLEENLSFSDKCEGLVDLELLNDKYDAFVCGSDQIWAPSIYNPRYYLDYVYDRNRIIAYAPSVGLSKINDENIKNRMKENLSRFKYISTREKSGSKLISDLIGYSVKTVLDPTLLISGKEWENYEKEVCNFSKPYLLVYMLGTREEYWGKINQIARELKLEIKIIPVFSKDLLRKGCITETIGPSEFLHLIHNASYICTDSYHGVLFSLNYNKNFTVFERFKAKDKLNQNSRIYNILNILDVEDRLYQNNKKGYLRDINYCEVNKKLDEERKKSLEYLKKSLELVRDYVNSSKIKKHIYQGELCCGCGACEVVCPTNAIIIERDDKGFYTANVDEDKCVSCGKCLKVCPYRCIANSKSIKNAKLYSYKDCENEVLIKSSSGGMGHGIAKKSLEKGKVVVGCVFSGQKHLAHHVLISKDEENSVGNLQGSKYMQSEFSEAMKKISNMDSNFVVFGTPCQIAGVKSILGERKDVMLVDLICHGVPSYASYKKYLEYLGNEKNLDISDDINTIFRYKPNGWRERYIYNADSQKSVIEHQNKDPYFLLFEHGFCYSKSCYECPWRTKSCADIRLGDYWGNRFKNDTTGVSMVLALTDKGEDYLTEFNKLGCGVLEEHPVDEFFACQQIKNNSRPVFWEELINDLNSNDKTMDQIVREYIAPFEKRKRISRKIYYFKSKLIKRKGEN